MSERVPELAAIALAPATPIRAPSVSERVPEARGHRTSPRRPHPSPERERVELAAISLALVRIFLAGASGVIGQRLIPRLVQAGHVVAGLTRSAGKTQLLSDLGAEPVLCDVFGRDELIRVVCDFKPNVMLNELTDLPDDAAQISKLAGLNARIRTEGNQNLIEAARLSGSPKILAQSVAWQLPAGPDAQAVAELERSVLAEGGVVLRYGQFYGPGTYHEQPPGEPRVHIDRAAERTVEALGEPAGIVVIID